jgi:hypothetical protein
MHWLDEAGGRYLHLVRSQQPRFLIELEVSQTEVETIFTKLEHFAEHLDAPRERRLCIAVAAVNAAALAEQDDSSFIELFYRRMHRPGWASSWEDTHAPAIWRALQENFELELQPRGSGKYVNSIYRHSGIPVRARAKFAAFLGKLLLSGGGAFTRREYDESLTAYPDSTAKAFLESDSGYNFTRYLAKWYGRRMLGTATDADLSPCWHELLISIERELSRGGPRLREAAATRGYREPYLALNMNSEQSRLEVRFDPRGIQKRIYSVAGKRVESNYLLADDEPLEASVRGEQPVRISPWWYPGQSPFAVFRASTGALAADPTALEPGVYWVATTEDMGSHREISLLDSPSCRQYYRLYEFDFGPGVSIPELGIRARGGATTPSLELTGGRPNFLGANLFQETPPNLRILNWAPGSGRRYMLWMNDGSGDRQLCLPHGGEDEITIPVRCPAVVEIWLEDIRNSANDVIDHVTFAVIPTVFVDVEEGPVGINDVAHLRGTVPVGWNIEWEPGIVRISNNQWRVPPALKIAEGQLLGPGVRVPVSLRIRRVSLREESGSVLLWKESFTNPDHTLRLEGTPDARYRLLAADNDGLRLLYPGSFDASGVSRFSASSFNDAAQLDQGSAVELVVELSNGRRFPTGLFVASATCLDMAEAADLGRLPRIGEALAKCRRLTEAPEHSLAFSSELLESPVGATAAELIYGASIFDASSVGGDLDTLLRKCSSEFIRVTDWFLAASAPSESGGLDATRIRDAYPETEVKSLPVNRWRRCVTDLRARLRANDEIPGEVSLWKTALLLSPRGAHMKAGIESRDGGGKLTEAIRLYAQSFSWQESEQFVAYTTVLKLLAFESSDPIIRLLAQSFRRVMLYRMGGAEAEVERPLPFDFPACFQRLQSTLDSLRGLSGRKWTSGMGLMEISPVAADADLEYRLGRPREMVAGDGITK